MIFFLMINFVSILQLFAEGRTLPRDCEDNTKHITLSSWIYHHERWDRQSLAVKYNSIIEEFDMNTNKQNHWNQKQKYVDFFFHLSFDALNRKIYRMSFFKVKKKKSLGWSKKRNKKTLGLSKKIQLQWKNLTANFQLVSFIIHSEQWNMWNDRKTMTAELSKFLFDISKSA